MGYKDTSEEANAHPGWGVRFSDGSWLGGAHGWFRTEEAFYADIYQTEEDARSSLKIVRAQESGYYDLEAEIVPAWQILCEKLRLTIHTLKLSAKVDIYDLDSAIDDLQYALTDLKKLIKH